MMVHDIFPANDFSFVAKGEASRLRTGIIIGYNESGEMEGYSGGMIDGRIPTGKDWLWLIESFKAGLINGDYAGD